jgi:hypothetical protein
MFVAVLAFQLAPHSQSGEGRGKGGDGHKNSVVETEPEARHGKVQMMCTRIVPHSEASTQQLVRR